jgi:uncharacterized protein YecE (DUF72 family)
LEQLDISRVATDPTPFSSATLPGGSRSFAYFRWHGSPRMYYSSYTDAQLRSFSAEVAAGGGSSAWCVFDNTALHAAWDNAAALLSQFSQPPAAGRLVT